MSPVESTTGNSSVQLTEAIIREIEEISEMTKSLNESMSQTDRILTVLQAPVVMPPPIVNVHSDVSTASSHTAYQTQPSPSQHSVPTSNEIPFEISIDEISTEASNSRTSMVGTVNLHE